MATNIDVQTDLRDFLAAVDEGGQLQHVTGAHWDKEMGAVVEVLYRERVEKSKAVLFDEIPGYPKGWRCLYGMLASPLRLALAVGMDLGLTEQRSPEGYPLTTATPERAILELLHLAPKEFDLVEAGQIVEGMTSLRPKLMQSLLEACTSVKVRRLFLYLAERADLAVMRHLKVEQIDLGSGDRSLVKMGRYVPKYRLLLPKELVSGGN